jgi:PHP family Zn ribbon phosphoesterase
MVTLPIDGIGVDVETQVDEIKIARHDYRCDVCGGRVKKGQRYQRIGGLAVHFGARPGRYSQECRYKKTHH